MKTPIFAAAGTCLLLLAAPAVAVPTTLSAISGPPAKIGNANVRDSNGRIIGAVQRVDVTSQGTPTKVSVALLRSGEKIAVLDAGQVKYDATRNEITTDASRKQLQLLYGQN